MSIAETARLLRTKKTSSVELTTECLRRIAQENPRLNAFLTVLSPAALARASALDQELAHGRDRGPLHGIPYAVKDVFATKGIRTTAGSKIFADHVPDHDAAVVERLDAAGMVLVGKTNMHELAYGITSDNPHYGAVRNPADPTRVAGGSSGGSASAVAAGMVPLAMGTDTGGSIRIPAAFCGCVGLKPTSGRVSRYGVLPLDFSLDHMGPLTQTVHDAALVLQALAGHDQRDDSSSNRPVAAYAPPVYASLRGLRIGVPESFFRDRLVEAVSRAYADAMQAAAHDGATLVPVRVPDMDAINTVGRVILLSEASALLEPYLHRRVDFGSDVLALLDQGRLLPATDYVNAQRLRRVYQTEGNRIWQQIDVLLTPTTPTPAPTIGQVTVRLGEVDEDVRLASTRLVRGFNVLGWPALSLPYGTTVAGLPIGLQLVAAAFQESTLLRAAAALERR